MNRSLATAFALVAALSLPGPGIVAAQGTEQGGFVTRLGSDTLAVERFTIDLASAGGGELRMRWDTTEWVVPVRVR